jgi:hypothetical protein
MEALFFVATVAIVAGLVLLALRGPRMLRLWRAHRADDKRPREPRLPADELESIVRELLEHRGFELETPVEGIAVARKADEARLVVQIEPSPPQERVPAERVRALAERVKQQHAQAGLLVTPYHIDRAAIPELPTLVELMDGRALLAAVDRELPHRVRELSRFRLTGTERAPSLDRRAVAR